MFGVENLVPRYPQSREMVSNGRHYVEHHCFAFRVVEGGRIVHVHRGQCTPVSAEIAFEQKIPADFCLRLERRINDWMQMGWILRYIDE